MPNQSTNVATPTLVIDLPTVRRNANRMAQYAQAHGLTLHPHTKTHKSLYMSELQLSVGAAGLAVAKAGEAEIMAGVCKDLLVAYPAIDLARSRRLAELARSVTLRVAVDSLNGVEILSAAARAAGSTVGILVDLDVGFHRTGVQSPQAAVHLAQQVASAGNLRLDGIFFYPGQVWATTAEQGPALEKIDDVLRETLDLFGKSGLTTPIVSGGSTPTTYQSHLITAQTDIRPGTYLYNDMNTVRGGYCTLDDCAATVRCSVVSTAVPGKVVIDAGTKTLTSDRNIPAPDSGFGYVVEYPQGRIMRLSEEHGELDVSGCDRKPQLGEQLTVIPNHICPCVNLCESALLRLDDGTYEPLRIDARGKTC